MVQTTNRLIYIVRILKISYLSVTFVIMFGHERGISAEKFSDPKHGDGSSYLHTP